MLKNNTHAFIIYTVSPLLDEFAPGGMLMEDVREKGVKLLRKNSGTLLAAAVALLTALVIFSGGVSASLGEDALRVSATFAAPFSVRYDEIRSARLIEDPDAGRRLSGMRGERIMAGRYLNGEFGSYTLYAYARVPLGIDLLTANGHVVINAANEEATRALYEELLDRLPDIP